MRKTLVPTAFLALVLGSLAACAHPSPPDGPYPTTPGKAAPTTAAGPGGTTTAGPGPADQTKDVCTEAISISNSDVATIRSKGAIATNALQSGDQATAVQAVLDLKKTATEWSAQLTTLSARPIKPELKGVLVDGAAKINTLAGASSVPADAESQLNDFTSKLAAACA